MTFRPVNAWVGFFIVTLLLGLSNGAAGAADPVVVPAVESSSPNYGARLFANDELFTTNDRSVATEHGGQIAAMNAAFDGTRMPPVRYTPVDVNEVLAAKSAAANPEHPAEGRAYFRARQADFHDAVRAAGLPQNNSTSACAYLVDSMYSVSGVTPTYRDKDGFRAACLFDVAREIVDHNNFFPRIQCGARSRTRRNDRRNATGASEG